MVHGAAELASMNESLRTELRNVQEILAVSGEYVSTPVPSATPLSSRQVASNGQTLTDQTSPRSEAGPRSHHNAQTSQLNRIHDNTSDASAARRELEEVLQDHEDHGKLSRRECQRIRGLVYQAHNG